MTKLVAVHEIIRRNAQGEREAVAPGAAFTASEAEANFYLACGAAVESKDAVAGHGTDVPDTDGPVRDLTKMRKPELVDIAKGLEIEGYEGMTVAQLIEAIQVAETAAEEDEVI